MKFNKKLLTPVLAIVLMASLVMAAYMLNAQSKATGHIISSDSSIVFSEDFGTFVLDTSTGEDSVNLTAILSNSNGHLDANVTLDIELIPLDLDCPNYEEDTTFTLILEGSQINTGDIISIPSGEDLTFTLKIDAVSRACPINATATMYLAEA